MSFFTYLYVISSDRNGYSKAFWTMFLLLFFVFGYFFYFISDEKFFFRKSKKRYEMVFNKNKFNKKEASINGTYSSNISEDCKYLTNTGDFPSFNNCNLNYFKSGTSMFDDILERIKCAEKFIFIEYFIVADGVLLSRFLSVLKEKVKEGVEVRLIYDDMGSHGCLSKSVKKEIRSYGIKLKTYNRLVPLFNIALNYRDHRKIVVVDGKSAYTGGANLADEYINEKRMHGYWKDASVRVDGPAVDSFTMIFLRQWEFLSKKEENYQIYFNHYEKYENDSVVVPYADGLDNKYNLGKNMYMNVINKAKEKIYIMTPYLILEEGLFNSLKNKALAGVDVRIILPSVPDKAYVYKVSLNYAYKLQKYGVKVYLLDNSFVHSKNLLTEYSAIVGSINMDLRSFYQQFESALYFTDFSTLKQLEADFNDTFSKSTNLEEKKNNLFKRIVVGLLRIISPLM